MKLTIQRYSVMLTLQTIFFIVDFIINIVSVLVRHNNGISLILLIVQSACLIFSLGSLFLTFFSTYAFQAGLIDLLYEKFHVSLIVFLIYFVVTVLLQVWLLVVQWSATKYVWSTPFFLLFIFQRTLTPIYYYYYKRATLRISDPRFYEDVWTEQAETKQTTAINSK